MSKALISRAYAQSLVATLAAYSAGRKLTPYRPSMAGAVKLYPTTCCFEGAER